MQEYELVLETNLSEELIESDFEVAVDRYGSLHIIVVTLETLELLLCLEPSSSSAPPPSLSLSSPPLSFSFCPSFCDFIFLLRVILLANASMLFPLARDSIWHSRPMDPLPETTVPFLILCLVCADRPFSACKRRTRCQGISSDPPRRRSDENSAEKR